MSGIFCKVCLKIYREKVPPRILPCGHSFCSPCLTQFLDTTKLCSVCRASLTHSYVYEYPINYCLLEISEEASSSSSSIKNLKRRLEVITSQHEYILTSASKMLAQKSKVEMMERNKAKILELGSKKDGELDAKEANAALDDIESLMHDVAKIFFCESHFDCILDLRLTKFESNKQFLHAIYNEIRDGNSIVAHKLIKGEHKFAKISIRDTTIFAHVFRYSPQDKPFQAKVIEFEDLKTAFSEYQIRAFIDFASDSGLSQRIFIDCLPQSIFAFFFLKLCTGEAGPSYLGCPLIRDTLEIDDHPIVQTKDSILYVKSLQTDLEYEDKYLEHLTETDSNFTCFNANYYVQLCRNISNDMSKCLSGSFEIFEISESSGQYPNVIGTSDSEGTKKILYDGNFDKVQSSGVAVTM